MKKGIEAENGIALIVVLWALTILMVIVLSFTLMAKTEALSSLAFKEGMEKKFLAEAGIHRGVMEIFYRNFYQSQALEEERVVWKIDGTPQTGKLGNDYYTVRITDESGKVDINAASELVLKNLLLNQGVQGEEADAIVDAMMDWKDPDDLHRLHGAEKDYYMSLPNPYQAKNAPFDTVEELLLVKGMTPELLYGTKERRGIIDFLTVHSKMDKININAASREVLSAVPGMTPELADVVINYRENAEIKNPNEALGEAGSTVLPYLTTSGTNAFTIDSLGGKEAGKGVYAVRATVMITSEGDFDYLYYKSPVDIAQ